MLNTWNQWPMSFSSQGTEGVFQGDSEDGRSSERRTSCSQEGSASSYGVISSVGSGWSLIVYGISRRSEIFTVVRSLAYMWHASFLIQYTHLNMSYRCLGCGNSYEHKTGLSNHWRSCTEWKDLDGVADYKRRRLAKQTWEQNSGQNLQILPDSPGPAQPGELSVEVHKSFTQCIVVD